jgi:hypothetical protein
MAEPIVPPRVKARVAARAWLRAIHRDLGHLAVGLTIVYALSGLAVNHVADWDPSFEAYEASHTLGRPLDGSNDAIQREVAAALGIDEAPRDVYASADGELEIVYEHRTLRVMKSTGLVAEEGSRPRFFLRVANWLHLNRGKQAWTIVADAYAAGLLLLALSGLLLTPGRKGLLGRGGALLLVGIALPVAYVTLSGGPEQKSGRAPVEVNR